MATSVRSFFNTFVSSILILLVHLGCFVFTTDRPHNSTNKKRKVTPLSPSNPSSPSSSSSTRHLKPHKSLSSSWSYIKRIFSFKHHSKKSDTNENETQPSSPTLASARSSQHSIVTPADIIVLSPPTRKRRTGSSSFSDPDFSLIDQRSFPLRNDIFPCPTCGEIFQKPQLVEHHQSIKHAVTELLDDDSGKNIVRIIFKTGWNSKDQKHSNPTIHRILKIHNSQKILSRFEEYRESVKAKEAKKSGGRRRDERCIADGNELLRFHCSTCICNLGQNGKSSICTQQYCSVCGIIRSGFSAKMDGISTVSSSWRAHAAFPEELEEEFAFMNVKRVMLVCRVIAGRIGSEYQGMICDKDEAAGFDSVIGGGGGGAQSRLDEEELLVFNPRAVLPCFAIIYSV
ncbi:zinc finger protein [Macleaya cordata]|uniref:Zinc finger protein n=1 Tax=Macleaya cordata TaxID=56857 RepID=A0A200R4K5_MACCD|nr:zinc finger protein [Macleaya cordata]